MALTATQIAARDGKLTASRVGILMNGKPEAILDLWKELTGDPSCVPEDLSDVWAVQLGSETEALHLRWYAKRTERPIARVGEVVTHPNFPWASCTLDAWDVQLSCPVECKHVGAWRKIEDCVETYQAQLHWQMICTNSKQAVLSVIFGSSEPVQVTIPFDETYATELSKRAADFWHCVENLIPPVILPPIAAPVLPSDMIEIDMAGNNAWSDQAIEWLENKTAAKKFDKAAKELKELVKPNCSKAFGHGIEITRSKSNALTIKETK